MCVDHVEDTIEFKIPRVTDFPILELFSNVFQEVPVLPPKRDIEFSINLVPKATTFSEAPYRMDTPKLKELKMHL